MSNDNKIAGAYDVSAAAGYAGDVAPATAWKILSERKDAVLIDVRTDEDFAADRRLILCCFSVGVELDRPRRRKP